MQTMKAVAVMEKDRVRVVNDVPIPEMGPYHALCRVRACGFCSGTDFQIIHDKTVPHQCFAGFPTILGHEGVGEVVAVGGKVLNIRLGDRYIHPHLLLPAGCGYTKTYGCMAEYGLVCDQRAMVEDGVCGETETPFYKRQFAFPESIPFADAAVLLSLSECYTAAVHFGVRPGDRALVYGAGPMGCGLTLFLKLLGASHVTVIDGIARRLAIATRAAKADAVIDYTAQDVDALLAGEKFNMVIDAVGKSDILLAGSRRLRPGGKVCSMGVLKSDDCLLDMRAFQSNACLHMLNFPYGEYDALPQIVRYVEEGTVDPKAFYSHVIPFARIQEALTLVSSREAFKVVLDFGGAQPAVSAP